LYTGLKVFCGPVYPEATMPRFVGTKTGSLLLTIIALIVLVVVVVVVLLLTGVIPVLGS
jgi:hypothetical protein